MSITQHLSPLGVTDPRRAFHDWLKIRMDS
jgi:hypothetical protein